MNNQEITDFQIQVKAAQAAILNFEMLPDDAVIAFSSGSNLAENEAKLILSKPVVKERVCAALQSISNDLDKITEKTTESLLGIASVGTLAITQNPLLYAWVGIIVYRATVKGFCVEFQKKTEISKK
jgi:hypothetical protein